MLPQNSDHECGKIPRRFEKGEAMGKKRVRHSPQFTAKVALDLREQNREK